MINQSNPSTIKVSYLNYDELKTKSNYNTINKHSKYICLTQ